MLVSSLTAGESIRKEDLRSRQVQKQSQQLLTVQALMSSCATRSREKTAVPWVIASVWTCCQLTSFPWGQVESSRAGTQLLKSSASSTAGPRICLDLTLLWMKLREHKGCTLDWLIRSQLFGHLKLRWPEWGSLYFWMQTSVQIINVVLLAHLKNSLGWAFLSISV